MSAQAFATVPKTALESPGVPNPPSGVPRSFQEFPAIFHSRFRRRHPQRFLALKRPREIFRETLASQAQEELAQKQAQKQAQGAGLSQGAAGGSGLSPGSSGALSPGLRPGLSPGLELLNSAQELLEAQDSAQGAQEPRTQA